MIILHLCHMTRYDISDSALIAAPPGQLFDVMTDFAQMPAWMPRHHRVLCKRTGAGYEGREVWLRPAPLLTVGWRIIEATPKSSFKLSYSQGWHTGYGKWSFEAEGEGTRMTYHMDMVPKNLIYAWMYRLVNVRKRHSREIFIIMGLAAARIGAPAPTDFRTVNA
jgi:uncharacterized protein YndB with AHSA1/START domain